MKKSIRGLNKNKKRASRFFYINSQKYDKKLISSYIIVQEPYEFKIAYGTIQGEDNS